jgi:hypothetical protein
MMLKKMLASDDMSEACQIVKERKEGDLKRMRKHRFM